MSNQPDEPKTLLVTLTGKDRPGVTSGIFTALAAAGVEVGAVVGDVAVGGLSVPRELLGAVGALEITLHGWDVAQALERPRPIPPGLAMDLWPVARDHITDADRPDRFGPVLDVPDWAAPQHRLLAHAGRC